MSSTSFASAFIVVLSRCQKRQWNQILGIYPPDCFHPSDDPISVSVFIVSCLTIWGSQSAVDRIRGGSWPLDSIQRFSQDPGLAGSARRTTGGTAGLGHPGPGCWPERLRTGSSCSYMANSCPLHHQPSSTIINHHQPSSTIINHHQPSSTIINHQIYQCLSMVNPNPNHMPCGSPEIAGGDGAVLPTGQAGVRATAKAHGAQWIAWRSWSQPDDMNWFYPDSNIFQPDSNLILTWFPKNLSF